MPSDVVYLDNQATTRVDPRVIEAMMPWFVDDYGNAGSVVHPFGQAAREAVERSRASLATAIDADPTEIVFTSGATESNNLALHGVAERPRRRGDHLISVTTEHAAVLEPLERLSRRGRSVTLLQVEPQSTDRAGWLDPQRVADAITDDTCLVSVMLANNEVGVVQPIREIAAVCRERGVLLHCDATQAIGRMPVSVRHLGVDLMSFSAHKVYGPKGVGALFVRRRDPIVRLEPLLSGGGQERGRRAGTLNVPGIVGFVRAMELCSNELPTEPKRLRGLRDGLWEAVSERVPDVSLLGPPLSPQQSDLPVERLPNNLTLGFAGLDGEALMLRMPRLAVSSGAACSAADP
ncbi:MAG: cysteine desulfurase family protein, partial [Planctomycetota bacterium]